MSYKFLAAKLIMTALTFVSITACAQPNYQNQGFGGDAQGLGAKGCELFFANQNACVDITWQTLPTDSEQGNFFLHFYDKETLASLEPSYAVAVVLWMPSMGHGSSPVKIEKVENSVYQVTNVFFVMPGAWEIRIQLKDGKNVVEQVIKSINI